MIEDICWLRCMIILHFTIEMNRKKIPKKCPLVFVMTVWNIFRSYTENNNFSFYYMCLYPKSVLFLFLCFQQSTVKNSQQLRTINNKRKQSWHNFIMPFPVYKKMCWFLDSRLHKFLLYIELMYCPDLFGDKMCLIFLSLLMVSYCGGSVVVKHASTNRCLHSRVTFMTQSSWNLVSKFISMIEILLQCSFRDTLDFTLLTRNGRIDNI